MRTSTEIDFKRLDLAPFLTEVALPRRYSRWWLLTLALLGLDLLAITAAFALAYVVRFKVGLPLLETPDHSLRFYSSVAFWTAPMWLLVFGAYRLYDRNHIMSGLGEYAGIVNACTIGMVGVIIASFLDPSLFISRGWLLVSWASAVALVSTTRFAFRRVIRWLRKRGQFMEPTIIVGANEEAIALAEHVNSSPATGLLIIGAVDSDVPVGWPLCEGVQVLGGLSKLEAMLRWSGAKELLVAPTAVSREELLDLYAIAARQPDVNLRLSSGLFEILTTGLSVKQLGGVSLISPDKVRITGVDATMKAALDYVGAALGLLVASPLLATIAVLIRLDSRGPVLHRRTVLGRGGRRFEALKFRTMVVNADEMLGKDAALREQFARGFKLKQDPRVTRVGRLLRRTSLDELPQLINVLMGQMSIVGPRMITPEESSRYGKWQLNLITVKPGITGPWQVMGRSEISYDERVSLSMHYIRNYTIWLDLQILWQTVRVVLSGKGAY